MKASLLFTRESNLLVINPRGTNDHFVFSTIQFYCFPARFMQINCADVKTKRATYDLYHSLPDSSEISMLLKRITATG